MRIVIIDWEDPTTFTDWISKKKAKSFEISTVRSVGIVVKETNKYIRIAMDMQNEGEEYNNVSVIPKAVITKIEFIIVDEWNDV